MNYQDDFEKSFSSQEEMMQFLAGLEKKMEWCCMEATQLKVIPLDGHPECQVKIENEESAGILEDTGRNTGLLIDVGGRIFPVGRTAMKTLTNRAKISGYALRLISKDKLARILNECMEVASEKALVCIRDGKVRATHSGQPNQYKVLPMTEIFRKASEVMEARYGGVIFRSGYFDQARATMIWQISDPELLKEYRELIERYEGSCPQLAAQIRVTTSDTADSGANIFYSLLTGPGKHSIAMGMAVKLEHKGDNSIEKFGENMETTFARYQEAARSLDRLMHIHITYPLNVMCSVMRATKIPRELREETVELYKDTSGTGPCSAYEVYCGICECLYLAEGKGFGSYAMTVLEEEVSKCLVMKYTTHDFPGPLKF